jgi:hypothetical protein
VAALIVGVKMSNPAKAKGSGAERAVVAWLKKWYPYVDRRLAGATLDKGDISGIPGVTIEIKNHDKMALSGWLKELETEMANDGAWTGVVIHKKRGTTDVGEWYATMPAKVWVELLNRVQQVRGL